VGAALFALKNAGTWFDATISTKKKT